jgi:hypothetical protein
MLAPFVPRTASLLRFFAAVSSSTSIAPPAGTRRLDVYLSSRAPALRAGK